MRQGLGSFLEVQRRLGEEVAGEVPWEGGGRLGLRHSLYGFLKRYAGLYRGNERGILQKILDAGMMIMVYDSVPEGIRRGWNKYYRYVPRGKYFKIIRRAFAW